METDKDMTDESKAEWADELNRRIESGETIFPDDYDGIPDTGERRSFETGAVRDASHGKPQITQIYPPSITRLAQRGTDGAKKYDDYNWAKGIPLSVYIDSLDRHLKAYQMFDNSEDHLAAIMWNAMGLMYTEDAISSGKLPVELDDLYDWLGDLDE